MHAGLASICPFLGNPEGFHRIHYACEAVPDHRQATAAGIELTGKDA
jgi:hypothetical protein